MEDKKINRAFNEMLIVAKKRLENKSPIEIAKNSGVEFCEEASKFIVKSLGKAIEINYPSYDFNEALDEWYILLLLHYLDLADGTPLCGQTVRFADLEDGLIRGTKFDKTMELELTKFLTKKEPEQIINVFKALDANIIKSKADLCAVLSLFPNYTVTLDIWFEDEEFEAYGKMSVDKSANHYLTIEDAVVVGDFVMKSILDKYDEIYK